MPWNRKADLRSTVPGPEGPQGLPGTGAVPADTFIAAAVAGPSLTKTALRQNGLTGWYNVEGNGVAVDGITDSTAELQAIFDALPWGATVYLPETGWDKFIKISSTIVITRPCRVLGAYGSTTAASIRSSMPGLTYFRVDSGVVVFENIGIYGDAIDSLGTDATQVGIHFRGTIDGDIDGMVKGCSLTRLDTGVLVQGRNLIVEHTSFSGTKFSTHITGADPAYHTGTNVDDHRGHVIRLNRYHGCGSGGGAFVYADITTQLSDLEISDNYFDQIGGRGFVVTGTASKPHNRVVIRGNRGMTLSENMYELTYVNQFTIRGETIHGYTGGDLMHLNNCVIGEVSDVAGFQLAGGGITARNCTRIHFDNIRFRQLGTTGATVHGFDIDSTNSQMAFDNITADEYTGWGFTGSPTDSRFGRYSFRGTAGNLGMINSTTFLPDQIFVPAVEMTLGAGSPSLSGQAGGVQSVGWLMDPTAVEQVSFQVPRTPVEWSQFSISILWAPTTAASGGVAFQYANTPLAAGTTAGSGSDGTGVVVGTAPGVTNRVVSTVMMSYQAPKSTLMQGRIIRLADQASDTYGADVAILGVLLTRTQ